MSGCPFHPAGGASRRGLLGAAVGFAALMHGTSRADEPPHDSPHDQPPLTKTTTLPADRLLPFYGTNQNGIVTPMQGHSTFATFDIVAKDRASVAAMMQAWTEASAKMAAGKSLGEGDDDNNPPDSGDILGLPPARLTLTFGFGPTLFDKEGADRFGLAGRRPKAFIELPKFVGDQLVPERTGGDISVQACADDPQATLHAIRQLLRLAAGVAVIRWMQSGFLPGYDATTTPRNLMGFKDGTNNVSATDPAALSQHVWVDEEGGDWMRGGTYLVARPIRIALEHWDLMKLSFQEQTIGRTKAAGVGLAVKGGPHGHEFTALDFDAEDQDGNPAIAENAHVRLAAPDSNDGAQILRRGYSYDNGVRLIAERWPPWRQGMFLDAGLFFVCYQRDPSTGFIKIFDRMSKFDMLNQFVTPVGGGLFACPGGVQPGRYIGQSLFEA